MPLKTNQRKYKQQKMSKYKKKKSLLKPSTGLGRWQLHWQSAGHKSMRIYFRTQNPCKDQSTPKHTCNPGVGGIMVGCLWVAIDRCLDLSYQAVLPHPWATDSVRHSLLISQQGLEKEACCQFFRLHLLTHISTLHIHMLYHTHIDFCSPTYKYKWGFMFIEKL